MKLILISAAYFKLQGSDCLLLPNGVFGSVDGEESRGLGGNERRGEEREGEWLPLPLVGIF